MIGSTVSVTWTPIVLDRSEATTELATAAEVHCAGRKKMSVAGEPLLRASLHKKIHNACGARRSRCQTFPQPPQESLFAQGLERSLDAIVIEFLIVAAEFFAAIGGAMEKLRHDPYRRVRLTFELRRAANVD